MTPAEVKIFNEHNFYDKTQLKTIKKAIPNFKLINIKTLKNINFNEIIGSEKNPKTLSTNNIKNLDFIMGSDIELNNKILSKFTIKNNRNKLLIMTVLMPYLLYTDINSDLNFLFSSFTLNLN